jgi:fatty-acyl-CoA synthase
VQASVPILIEHHLPSDLMALDEAWSDSSTFAFLPDKSGVAEEWIREALNGLPDDLHQGHFALLTSGSTGRPKLVIGNKHRAEELAGLLHEVQNSEPVTMTIAALPLTYCYSFVNQWLWARRMNQRLVPTRGFAHPDELRDALRTARAAMLCLVRVQLPLFREVFGDEVFPGIIRVHFAGGTFPQAQIVEVQRRFPAAEIFNNYGCAEAMPRLTVRRAEDGTTAGDIGVSLPGIELRTAESGELQFRSPYRAVAWFDDNGLHRVDDVEWVGTGDLGNIDDRGHWRITGRSSEVFKRFGEKVSLPQLLETVQSSWPGAAAFYRERDPNGEEGHVLVVAPRAVDEGIRAILQAFRSAHPRSQWPLRIETADILPTLPNGKIDTAALPALDGKHISWRQRL